jgi:subtilisin family serine protease
MDGKTAPISRAAAVAVSKGMLVLNAVGNEGENAWGTVVAPADVDNVLTVGGIDPRKDVAAGFTSPGPAADGTAKPNISNLGTVFSATPKRFNIMQGTSFSTPLSAGFAACYWQANPGAGNLEVFDQMEKAGHLYPYFDYLHGDGIPQAKKALGLATPAAPTFEVKITDDYVNIRVDTIFVPESDDEGELLTTPKNIYYKIVRAKGQIHKYGVVLVESIEPLYFEREELREDDTLIVHFEGYTQSIDLKEN